MDPLIGQIMMFAGTYAPKGWAFCDGQLLSIQTYQALYAVITNVYGGDGVSTFALPDLRGRVPMHAGTGPNLSPRALADSLGTETASLSTAQMPIHNHGFTVSSAPADSTAAAGEFIAQSAIYSSSGSNPVQISAGSVGMAGRGLPHDNIQPSLCLNFIIALEGIYPPHS